MANEIGSILHIDDSFLKSVKEADDALAALQKRSQETADTVNKAMDSMAKGPGLQSFKSSLKDLAVLMASIGTTAKYSAEKLNGMSKATSAVSGAGKAAKETMTSMAQLSEMISRASGESANLAAVASAIKEIKRALATDTTLNLGDQQGLVDKLDELKKLQKSMMTPTVAYEGAMKSAESAASINERTAAIKQLTAARAQLKTTDADYTNKLNALNAKIKEMNAANKQAAAGARELRRQHSSLINTSGQLGRVFALLFSVSQIRGYIASIVEVRGQFEMAQRSLQALLGNKTQADEIFSQTVALAVQSPYRIKDLVQYTRQLAAYRIENDKLYDTTKRLADVSAGLGVDMQRMILAYGQVKAAAYLKGTEVRQFTEAGVNIYKELQEYFKEERDEDYTTAEIVNMISRRKVTFEDVERVFERMTDKGGMFYNMQLIQSETLQGKVMKFKDSVDIMLNEIGTSLEPFFKGALDNATAMLKNWQAIINVIFACVTAMAALSVRQRMLKTFADGWFFGLKRSMAEIRSGTGAMGKLAAVMKSAFGGPLLAAASVAFSLIAANITEAAMAQRALRDAIKEANAAAAEQLSAAQDIAMQYQALRDAAGQSADVGEEYNQNKGYEARKRLLDKLAKEMEDNNYNPVVDLSGVNPDNIDDTFKAVLKSYRSFLYDMLSLREDFSQSVSQGETIKDYDEAANGVAALEAKIESLYNFANANYDKLSDSQKEALDGVREGLDADKKTAEDLYGYYQRLKDIYTKQDLPRFADYGSSYGAPTSPQAVWQNWVPYSATAKKDILDMRGAMEDFAAEGEKVKKVMQTMWKTLDTIGKDTAKSTGERVSEIRDRINTLAASQEWGAAARQIAKELAEERYEINLTIDEEGVKEQLFSIEDYLNQWIDDFNRDRGHDIVLHLDSGSFEETAGTEFVGNLSDEIEKAAKSAKKLKELYEWVGKWKVAGIVKNDAMTDEEWNKLTSTFMGSAADPDKTALIPKENIQEYLRDQAEQAGEDAAQWGGDLGDGNKKAQKTVDLFRQWSSVLEEINKRYEKLRQYMSGPRAQNSAIGAYSGAIEQAGVPDTVMQGFTPDDEGLRAAFERMRDYISDSKQLTELQKKIGELTIEIDQDKLKEELGKAKKTVEQSFKNLDLYKALLDTGMQEYDIREMFPGIATSYADVEKTMAEQYAGREGTEWQEEYDDRKKELGEKRQQDEIDMLKQLVKSYGQMLSDQLQLDLWYQSERNKIMSNTYLAGDTETRDTMLGNLAAEYEKKSAENKWNEFRGSNFYVTVFDDIETQSTRMLKAMRDKLEDLKGSLSGLTPGQLNTVLDAEQKINDELAERSPFKSLISGIKEYTAAAKTRNEDEQKYLDALKEQERLKGEVSERTQTVRQDEAGVARLTDSGASGNEINAAKETLKTDKETLKTLEKEEKEQEDIVGKTEEQANASAKALQKIEEASGGIAKLFDDTSTVAGGLLEVFSDFGIDNGFTKALSTGMEFADGMSNAFLQMASGNTLAGVIGLVTSLSGLFGSIFGNHDNKLQKKIEKLEDEVHDLENAFEDLEDAMDEAWSTDEIEEYEEEGLKNLQQQIEDYYDMIELEQDKKDTDEDQIQEWKDDIADLEDEIEDLQQTALEKLGGIGEGEYAAAAEEFADAWVEAFNETEDGLEALKDTWADYYSNLLTKYATTTVTEKYLDPLFEKIDEAANELGDTGEISEETIEALEALADENLPALNEALEELFGALGISPSGSDSSLSALEQGIEGITEDTAEALESLLNSIRFFLATQQADVAVIKTTLIGMADGTSAGGSSLTLTELKSQTAILTSINNMFANVIKSGHPLGGKGIKVFMD